MNMQIAMSTKYVEKNNVFFIGRIKKAGTQNI